MAEMKGKSETQRFSGDVAKVAQKTVLSPEKVLARAKMPSEKRGLAKTIEGARLAKGIFEIWAEKTLESQIGNTPEEYEGKEWKTLDEDDQEEIMFGIHDLVAQAKDLKTTVKEFEGGEEQAPQFKVQIVGGRRVRVPVPAKGVQGESYRSKAAAAARERLTEIEQELADFGAVPGVKEAYIEKLTKYYFLMKAGRLAEERKDRVAEIENQILEIRTQAEKSAAGTVVGAQIMQINRLEEELELHQQKINSLDDCPGGREFIRLNELKEFSHAYQEGMMIEVPSLKESIDQALENMRLHQPFLLAGHLGSGKTETAKHAARLFMMENGVGYKADQTQEEWYRSLEPEMFSGSEGASVYDLVGKLKLVGRAADDPTMLEAQVLRLEKALDGMGVRGMSKEELAKLVIGKGDVTETIFNYGPFGRALKNGTPIIIDEVNRIPPEVLSRINDVMLRGVGSQIRLQENGEEAITMKKGFSVLGTCNLGAQYAGLQEVDAAFKSRWVAREVFYPEASESYDLMLSALLRKDRVRLPPDFPADGLDKMIDLAVMAREIQEIFAGKTDAQRFMATARGAVAERSQLEKAVVSTRDLMRKIIKPWKGSGFKTSVDEIIAKNILAAEVFSAEDQKMMTEMFIRRGFLDGWMARPLTSDELKKKIKENPDYVEPPNLEEFGIRGVSQAEIDALQAAMMTDDYILNNKAANALRASAHGHATLARAELMIGTKSGSKPRKSST